MIPVKILTPAVEIGLIYGQHGAEEEFVLHKSRRCSNEEGRGGDGDAGASFHQQKSEPRSSGVDSEAYPVSFHRHSQCKREGRSPPPAAGGAVEQPTVGVGDQVEGWEVEQAVQGEERKRGVVSFLAV